MNIQENYFFNLVLRKSETKLHYFSRCFFTSTLLIFAVPSVSILLFGLPKIVDFPLHNLIVDLILIVGVAPFIESFLLTFQTAVAKTAVQSDLVAAIVGASFIAALHAFSGITKVLIMFPVFSVQAIAYIQLRKNQNSYSAAFFFVFALHALHNLMTMALGCLNDL